MRAPHLTLERPPSQPTKNLPWQRIGTLSQQRSHLKVYPALQTMGMVVKHGKTKPEIPETTDIALWKTAPGREVAESQEIRRSFKVFQSFNPNQVFAEANCQGKTCCIFSVLQIDSFAAGFILFWFFMMGENFQVDEHIGWNWNHNVKRACSDCLLYRSKYRISPT